MIPSIIFRCPTLLSILGVTILIWVWLPSCRSVRNIIHQLYSKVMSFGFGALLLFFFLLQAVHAHRREAQVHGLRMARKWHRTSQKASNLIACTGLCLLVEFNALILFAFSVSVDNAPETKTYIVTSRIQEKQPSDMRRNTLGHNNKPPILRFINHPNLVGSQK